MIVPNDPILLEISASILLGNVSGYCFHTASQHICGVLEKLTLCTGLDRLTGVAIRQVFSKNVGVRGSAGSPNAWCARCYSEQPIRYNPLIWSFVCLTHCPIHGTLLSTTCPTCGAPQKERFGPTPIGLCWRCGIDLGATLSAPTTMWSEEGRFSADWVRSSVKFLQANPDFNSESVRLALFHIRRNMPRERRRKLAAFLGVSVCVLHRWLQPDARIKFSSCLHICRCMRISLDDLLKGVAAWRLVPEEQIYRIIRRLRKPPVQFDRDRLSRALDRAAAARSPKSTTRIAAEHGVLPHNLRSVNRKAYDSIAHRASPRRRVLDLRW